MPGRSAAKAPNLVRLYERLVAQGAITSGKGFRFNPNARLDTSQVQSPWLPRGMRKNVEMGVLLTTIARMQKLGPAGAIVFEDGSIRYAEPKGIEQRHNYDRRVRNPGRRRP